MKIAHVVISLAGTSIPVEIATAIDTLPKIDSHLISENNLDELPDTTNQEIVIRSLCGTRPSGLVDKLEQQGYDIIHTHHNRLAAKVGLRSRASEITHVNTQHGHIHYTVPQKWVNAIVLATSDGLVYNSEATQQSYNRVERLLKRGASEHICPNGVDMDRIAPYRTTINDVTVGVTACRLIKRKNLQPLIKAMQYVDLHLQIVGDGPQRESLEALTERYGLSDSVEFFGYLEDRADVYAAMAEADVFVLPSHAEGFGVSVAEAMAIGLPPIVSDIPVFHEVVGDAGVFVKHHAPKDIADGIRQLQDDPELTRRLSQEARRRIETNFTLSQTAHSYADAYEQITDGQSPKRRT